MAEPGEGGEQNAPLGRAVIGGLVMSTFATLLVVPSIFALVIGRSVARSPSIYPDDPESPHYDPLLYAHEGESGAEGTTPLDGDPVSAPLQSDGHPTGSPPSAPAKAAPLPGDP